MTGRMKRGRRPTIVVVGSLNVDRVATVARLPGAGETVLADKAARFAGGKGANQAVAAARLGRTERVALCGAVGGDADGRWLLDQVGAEGVDVSQVARSPDLPTGTAFITVDRAGENQIVVVAGANAGVTPERAAAAAGELGPGGLLLVQLEIPVESVAAAVRVARERGATVILDPAPAPEEGRLPGDLLACVDWLTPNARELAMLGGSAEALLEAGVGNVLETRGAQGVVWYPRGGPVAWFEGLLAEVVDATGAGDAFNGGLAIGLRHGCPPEGAISLACGAAALSVTREGAQASLPYLREMGRAPRD